MKKIIISAGFIASVLFAQNIYAQNITTNDLPEVVKKDFSVRYPGATAEWNRAGRFIEGKIIANKHNYTIAYKLNGEWEHTQEDLSNNDFPFKEEAGKFKITSPENKPLFFKRFVGKDVFYVIQFEGFEYTYFDNGVLQLTRDLSRPMARPFNPPNRPLPNMGERPVNNNAAGQPLPPPPATPIPPPPANNPAKDSKKSKDKKTSVAPAPVEK